MDEKYGFSVDNKSECVDIYQRVKFKHISETIRYMLANTIRKISECGLCISFKIYKKLDSELYEYEKTIFIRRFDNAHKN